MVSINGYIIVLKDSEIANSLGAVNSTIIELREKLVSEGIIAEENNQAFVTKDYVFSSPSLAATIVLGISANGRKEWKHNGRSLKDLE